MINKLKKNLEILSIFLVSLTPLLWFKGNEVIIGHDSGFRLNYLEHLGNLFYSWNPIHNFGTDWGILKGFLIIQVPETFFSWLFNSLALGEKLSFILWFFLIGISMYIFINNFFPKKEFWIFRMFSSLFYMFNFFILQGWFIAERAKFSLFAALPLGILIIYKTLSRDYSIIRGTILFSIVSFFLNGGGSPPLYGSLLLAYSISFLYLTFLNILQGGLRQVLLSFKVFASFALGFFAINAYYIFPHINLILNKYTSTLSSIGGIEGIIAWENAVNKFSSFINLFRLQGIPDWYDNINHPYSEFYLRNPILIVLSLLPIAIIIFGFLWHQKFSLKDRQDKLFYLIFLIFIVGLIFTSGSHPPFGFLYIFLVKYLPGFAMFRSAFYKFGPVVWFSTIFLAGYYLNLLLNNFRQKNLRNLLGVLAIIFILTYHFPFFTVNFFEFSKPFTTKVDIPNYVNDTKDYLNGLDPNIRILLLPQLDPVFKADSYKWGFWSLETLPKLSLNYSIISNDIFPPSVIHNIYGAVNENGESSFLRLSGSLGINKILWRNDVLYNDKTTTSKEFSFEKDNISKFSGVFLSREIGEWKIYDIKSKYYLPIFYSPKRITYAKSQQELIGDLLSRDSDPRSLIIFSEGLESSQDESLKNIVNDLYIQANCVLCKDKELDMLKSKIEIPHVKLLPNSSIYFLNLLREDTLFKKYENFPEKRIDVNISFTQKRVAELSGIIFEEKLSASRKALLIDKNIDRYKLLIKDAIAQLSKLPEESKNFYSIRILSYLEVHENFLDRLRFREGFSEKSFNNLLSFLNGSIKDIKKEIWMSSSLEHKKLIFRVVDKGIYNLTFIGEKILPDKILLNGNELKSMNDINLDPGVYRLELRYRGIDNLILNYEDNNEFFFKNSDRKIFTSKKLEPGKKYSMTFDYKIIEGDNALFSIFADPKSKNFGNAKFNLRKDARWKSFSYEFSAVIPEKNNENSDFYFSNQSQELNLTIFKNFKLTEVFIPKVFISKKLRGEDFTPPRLTFQRVNPTQYIVHVENAKEPYLVVFGESYDNGWKIYKAAPKGSGAKVVSDYFGGDIRELENRNAIFGNFLPTIFAKSLTEKNHFKINGYANGWYLEDLGTYDLIVSFQPQGFFYIGTLITSASLILFLTLLYKLRKIR